MHTRNVAANVLPSSPAPSASTILPLGARRLLNLPVGASIAAIFNWRAQTIGECMYYCGQAFQRPIAPLFENLEARVAVWCFLTISTEAERTLVEVVRKLNAGVVFFDMNDLWLEDDYVNPGLTWLPARPSSPPQHLTC
jgi:hypothetical protein